MLAFVLFLIINQASAEMITSPAKCYEEKTYPCSIVNVKKSTLARGGNGFYLSANSFLVFESKNILNLYRGAVWVHARQPLSLKTKYGVVKNQEHSSEFWIDSSDEHYGISVISGVIEVEPKGGSREFISSGRSAVLATVDYSLQSCYLSGVGVMSFQKHLRKFSNVFPFGAVSVEEHLAKVQRAILLASEEEGRGLQVAVARRLASAEENKILQKVEEQDARLRDEYLKRLFRIKSNFEEI